MPQSLVKILVHVVFSTKDRMNLIAPEIEDGLYGYISGIIKNNNSRLIIAGGTVNHIHLLISLGKKIDIGELVGDIKRDSSKWMKEQGVAKFYWQKGYGAFSIGQSRVKAVVVYIKNQKTHHAKQDYKEEFRELLTKYEIDFDERYVWD
jgi:REP element-mobilizing transposase RayT